MTWQDLLAQRRVALEATSRDEIADLWVLARRYLKDAKVEGLSDDGRFDRAYGAARILATLVIRAEGYRVKARGGAHYTTFLALEAADAEEFGSRAAYFDQCRAKRNELSYDAADVVSESEVEELTEEALLFASQVSAWLDARHPELVRG